MIKLDHIGIAVKDLDEAIKFYRDVLNLNLMSIEEVVEEGVRVAMFDVGGVRIELLQGIRDDSAITKFIEKRGEGIHHIAFHVENVDDFCRRLSEKGVQLTYPEPKLVAGGSRKINFIHPRSAKGVLVEVLSRVGGSE